MRDILTAFLVFSLLFVLAILAALAFSGHLTV
jgi:hypothetical protein